jgi:hypothetical protein
MPIIPAIWEAEIGKITDQIQPGKVSDASSQLISQEWHCTTMIPAMIETKVGESQYKAGPQEKYHEKLPEKSLKAKMGHGSSVRALA